MKYIKKAQSYELIIWYVSYAHVKVPILCLALTHIRETTLISRSIARSNSVMSGIQNSCMIEN